MYSNQDFLGLPSTHQLTCFALPTQSGMNESLDHPALYPLLRYVNLWLVAWVMHKFKRFKGHKTQASQPLQWPAMEHVDLFTYWHTGMTGMFA